MTMEPVAPLTACHAWLGPALGPPVLASLCSLAFTSGGGALCFSLCCEPLNALARACLPPSQRFAGSERAQGGVFIFSVFI